MSDIQKARTEALEAIRQAVSDGGAVQAGDRLDLGKLKDKVRLIGDEVSELQVRMDQGPGQFEGEAPWEEDVARLRRRLDDMGPQMARQVVADSMEEQSEWRRKFLHNFLGRMEAQGKMAAEVTQRTFVSATEELRRTMEREAQEKIKKKRRRRSNTQCSVSRCGPDSKS